MKDYEDMTFEELTREYEKFAGKQITESERVLLVMMHTEIIDAYKRGFAAGVHSTRKAVRHEY